MNNRMLENISRLPNLSADELKKQWRAVYGKEPPPFNRVYYIKRLAYRIQELAYGVNSAPLERRLELHARQHMDLQGKVIRKPCRRDRPISGTRFVREYHGEDHVVTVLHHGFDYRGRRYKSLSSIARVITGTQWSGPLFFGLKSSGGRA